MSDSEQLMLPVETRPTEYVSWYNVTRTERRRLFLGKKVVTELIKSEETGMPSLTTIKTEEISNLEDAKLRYALRLKAAALSVGWVVSGESTKGAYDVIVEATDEGYESQLVSADYYGVVTPRVDTFMRNLHRLRPQPEVPGMTASLVHSQDGEPDTRFWVPSR